MKNKELFQETQSFLSKWAVIGFVMAVVLFFLYKNEDLSVWSTGVVLGGLAFLSVIGALFSIRLRTRIDTEGIHIDFKPFVWNKIWKWADIEQVKVKKYSLWDYGGWGYRIGKEGLAYTTNGLYGFQVKLKNGKKILVGTQYPEQVQEVLHQIAKDDGN